MNQNNKSRKNRSMTTSVPHGNAANVNSKGPRQKSGPLNERTVTPEGIYVNGRVMHVTTSLVGCVVQIEVKDGTRYEGVLKTFSPDFELVIETVAKVEPNVSIPVANNIGNLLASLQAKNSISTVIFNYTDVVKLTAVNVDLDFATNKSHMLTDTEISRFDQRTLTRDRELIPWEGTGDDCDSVEESLDNHGTAQNGWDPNDMFKTNEEKFKVRTTYEPSLKDYTVPLVHGEGEEFEQKLAEAARIANEIEGDDRSKDRYNREVTDGDEEEMFSAVSRTNESTQHSNVKNQQNRRKQNAQNNSNTNYSNVSGGANLRNRNYNANSSTQSPFHSKPTPSSGSSHKHYSNSQLVSSPTASYQPINKPIFSNQHQTNKDSDSAQSKPQYAGVAAANYAKPETDETPPNTPNVRQTVSPPNQVQLPQRNHNDNRRAVNANKRKDEVSDLKKFSTDFKLPVNESAPSKDKTDMHVKDNYTGANASSVKTKDSVSGGVKDKLDSNVHDKDVEKPFDSGTKPQTSPSQSGPVTDDSDKLVKKSTLNPNAKTFTPRSSMGSVTSSTPPSVPSTPSSVASLPMTQSVQHHSHHHHHHQQQSQQQQQQQRLTNPLMQLPPHQYISTPITIPMTNPGYIFQNVQMGPAPFTSPNVNQNQRFRGKGPQGPYSNHGIRHDFSQPSAHVAAATGHPVLASAPIPAPQLPVSVYQGQQPTGIVTQTGPQQQMYHHNMYGGFHPRMNTVNIMPPQMGMMQHTIQYDASQLQHMYAPGAVQLQHMVSQAQAVHQHVSNSGQHSNPGTPQSGTPTALHGAPAQSPVLHQPNQPPTPTPQQPTVMYTGIASPHNPQSGVPQGGQHPANPGNHPYHQQILVIPGQAVQGHHGPTHGSLHHALSHNAGAGNHHGGPAIMSVPVQLISSNAAQNPLSFAPNPGV